MGDNKKILLKEINLWKKRLEESKKNLNSVYRGVQKEAKKVYREALK